MTPAARIQAAIEILDQIAKGTPAEAVLTRWSRSSKFAGSKDRNAVRDHVFDVLRCKRSSAAFGGGNDGRSLVIGYLRQTDADLETLFGASTYGPVALSEHERELLEATPSMATGEKLDFPDWLLPELETTLGDDLNEIAQLFRRRAPVFLRVNIAKTDVETALEQLIDAGYTASKHPLSETAILIEGTPKGLRNHALFLTGEIELQDAASQAIVDVLPIAVGTNVLDYCAGGGGKALAMAAKGARVTASDIDPNRMRDIPIRSDRAGTVIRVVEQPDVNAFGPYDIVLCDAPCSGTGAWRRQPDAKWRLTSERLAELQEIQGKILEDAALHVAENGTLAFATCSLLPAENIDIVNSFTKRNPDWESAKTRKISPLEGADGFFLALLTRVS